MKLCLRFDLEYLPWQPRVGHGEPALVLRLLALARGSGLKYHFLARGEVVRCFRHVAEEILNEGHALGWLGDEDPARAQACFDLIGLKAAWDEAPYPTARMDSGPEEALALVGSSEPSVVVAACPEFLAEWDPELGAFQACVRAAMEHGRVIRSLHELADDLK